MIADLDPVDDESPEAAKARYLQAIADTGTKVTAVINSGNGIQVLVRLVEPIKLAHPVEADFTPETAAVVADVEARSKALMQRLGAVAGTQNIDRILRLPGTVNLPNKTKRAKGRTACPASLISFNGPTARLEDFPKSEKTVDPSPLGDRSTLPANGGVLALGARQRVIPKPV